MSLVTGLLSPVLRNQQRTPPLKLQVSACSTFRIMCDVPSIAVFLLLLLLLLLLRYYCLLSQGFSPRYLATNSEPHHSSFKFQPAVLSTLCVMFQVLLPFAVRLLNVFLAWLPNFSLNVVLLFQWLKILPVQSHISCSTYVVSLYITSCILTSFLLPFAHSHPQVLPHLTVFMFSLFVFNYLLLLLLLLSSPL